MRKEVAILEKVSLFHGILPEDLESILTCLDAKVREYGKNQSIKMAGDKFNSLGIVISGNVQITREDIMGNRTIVASLIEGEIFGETFACAGIEVSPVSIYSLGPSKILWVSIKKIVTTCSSSCDFHSLLIQNLLQLLATKNMYLNNKMDLLSRRSTREKVMAYLISQADSQKSDRFAIPLNRNELADYLCIDRSAMSRELGKLREEGIIEFHKNSFHILEFTVSE
ncbi:MAG: Crp/Fnr family transcriptional regulator [Anaerocolumna sp.]|jgi:CRP-like cAMP-binding protein|nr:Crp/Fnr family transcriptional regulator [Anaerocolumna sp.]